MNNQEMAVAAFMWVFDQETSRQRQLIDGYKARRVTLHDPWKRTVDTLVNPHYGTSAAAWIIRQYVGAA